MILKIKKLSYLLLFLLVFSINNVLQAQCVITQIGSDIDGQEEYINSGYSVSMSSDGLIIAIGAINSRENGLNCGQIRIYKYKDSFWEQVGLNINGKGEYEQFGYSTSLSSDGKIIAVGAPFNSDSGELRGCVRVFKYINNTWNKLGDDILGESILNNSGHSISLSEDGLKIAIGAYLNEGGGKQRGSARIFEFKNNKWIQLGSPITGQSDYDYLGNSVSLNKYGNVLAVGAIGF